MTRAHVASMALDASRASIGTAALARARGVLRILGMRTHMLSKLMLIGVGGGVAAYIYGKSRHPAASVDEAFDDSEERDPTSIPDSMDIDRADPVQTLEVLNALHDEELGVDAMSAADAETDFDVAASETFLDEAASELEPAAQATLDSIEQSAHDVGDLYGARTPAAADREHPDDDTAFNQGQNWIEALEASATEMGPTPETALDDVLEAEELPEGPRPSLPRDTPVADRGSGGPAGM